LTLYEELFGDTYMSHVKPFWSMTRYLYVVPSMMAPMYVTLVIPRPDCTIGVPLLYWPVTKAMPWTRGKVRTGSCAPEGTRLTFAEKPSRLSVVKLMPLLSSAAEITNDWSPRGFWK